MQISEDVMSAITGMMLSDGHIFERNDQLPVMRDLYLYNQVNQLNVNILILY